MKSLIALSAAFAATAVSAQLPFVVAGWDFDTNDLGALFDASQTENIAAQVPFSRAGSRINTSGLYQNQGVFSLDLGEGPFELEYSNFNLQQVNVEGTGGNPTTPADISNYIFARGFEVEPSNNNGMLILRGRNTGNVVWDDFGITGPERGNYIDFIVNASNVSGLFFQYDVSPLTSDWQKMNSLSVSVNGGAFQSLGTDNLTGVATGTWATRIFDLGAFEDANPLAADPYEPISLVLRYTYNTSETADDDSPFGIGFDNIGFFGLTVGTPIPEPSTYAAIFGLLSLGYVVYRRRSRR